MNMKTLFLILTVLTTYSHGEYTTTCERKVDVSQDRMNEVVNMFFNDMQTDINGLFKWAFKGTENDKKDSTRNTIQIKYKESYAEPERHYGKQVIDVIVPHFKTFKDISIESSYTDTTLEDRMRAIHLTIDYSGSLLKDASADFNTIPITDNSSYAQLTIRIKFGFFFNLFISRKMYINVIEWRINQMFENLCEMAEKGEVTVESLSEVQ